MNARRTRNPIAMVIGLGLLLLAVGLGYRVWDNGRVRVRSTDQAVAMARAAAGPQVSRLPMAVEAQQDFWTIRFGPDGAGRMHSYLVSIWDRQAGPLLEDITTDVAIRKPE